MIFSRNIIILFILRAVRWFLLIMPIITIFYRDNGLSMQEIFFIQSAFAIAVVLFEVPTGYFSDVVGRRKSLILGMFFGAVGMGLYSFSTGFWGFLIAELILGLGSSFISGTDSAMLYDTLLDEGHIGNNKKIQGYLQSISSFSESLASLLGGFLAVFSIYLPFYVQFGFYVSIFPLLFFLNETKQHKHDNKDGMIHGIYKIIKYSLHEHKEIKWLILFSGGFGCSTLIMTWLLQSYFTYVGLPLVYFGLMWSLYNISLIPFSFFAHRIEGYLGRQKSIFFLALLPCVGYLLLATVGSIAGLIFVFLFYFARGFASVVLSDYVNVLVASPIRATVLSIQALVMRAFFVILGPGIGWISDIYSLQIALLSSGVIFSFLSCISIFFLWRNKILDI